MSSAVSPFSTKTGGQSLSNKGFCTFYLFFVCVCVCFLIVTYPGFYFVFMGFICVLISIGCLSGGYFLLVSPRKFCFYTFCCLHFQTWPSFQRLYRSGKDWGSFLWFCLLCWTHGWKPPWEVLHCNTNMDKLNLLGFFFTSVSMSWCDHVNHNCNPNISFSLPNTGFLIHVKILLHLR